MDPKEAFQPLPYSWLSYELAQPAGCVSIMKISLFLVASILLGGHFLDGTLAEESLYEEQEEESYLYYYEDENIAASKTTETKTIPTTVTESSSSPLPQEEAATPRKNENSVSIFPSGFTQKPRDDDEIDDETSNVTPLWDNEPYMLEVKASYGCIMQDERIQLDNELFGFEVEVSDMEKLKQDRMQRIRKDREREWNRKESVKLPKQQVRDIPYQKKTIPYHTRSTTVTSHIVSYPITSYTAHFIASPYCLVSYYVVYLLYTLSYFFHSSQAEYRRQ